jgi:hypothetical protein
MDGYEPKHQWILTVKIAPRSSNVLLGSALERSISISIGSFYMIQLGYTNLCLISPARTCGSVVHVLHILQQILQNAIVRIPGLAMIHMRDRAFLSGCCFAIEEFHSAYLNSDGAHLLAVFSGHPPLQHEHPFCCQRRLSSLIPDAAWDRYTQEFYHRPRTRTVMQNIPICSESNRFESEAPGHLSRGVISVSILTPSRAPQVYLYLMWWSMQTRAQP